MARYTPPVRTLRDVLVGAERRLAIAAIVGGLLRRSLFAARRPPRM